MNRRQLHRLARTTLRRLDLRPPLNVDLLRERLGEQRERPIELQASTELVGRRQFGFTATSPDADCDVIFYEVRTSRTHQLLIILHELAHLICNHPFYAIDHSYRTAYMQEFQTISPEAIAGVFSARPPPRPGWRPSGSVPSLYDDPAEWEAETMATILMSWVPGCGEGHITPAPADPLEDILGDVPAW